MAAGDLTDLATVKAWLGINQATSDSQLSGLITAASAFINQYLNRQLLSASYVEVYQGAGHDFMLLRQAPVTAVTLVEWTGTSLSTPGDPIAPTPGPYVDPDQRTLRLVGYCFPYRQPVRVTYTAGYAAVPKDVSQACVELVGEGFKRREHIGQTNKVLASQETIGFSQADMNASIKGALRPYQFVSPL